MKNAVVVMDSANSNPYGLASFWQLVKDPFLKCNERRIHSS